MSKVSLFLTTLFFSALVISQTAFAQWWFDDEFAIDFQRVDVTIQDQIATTHLDMQFRSIYGSLIEGQYLFPIPEDATITELILYINGEPIVGEVLGAVEAGEIYQNYVNQLIDPALLEYIEPGLVQVNVFPITDTRRIEITYQQVLLADEGVINYVFPQNSDYANKEIAIQTLDVTVNSNEDIASINSSSHAVAIQTDTVKTAAVSYEADTILPDRNFNLTYTVTQESIGLNLLSYNPIPDPYANIELQLSSGLDDAEERADGTIYFDSSDLEIGRDAGANQLIGLRYQNVNIPPNATITSAKLIFTVDEAQSEAAEATFYGSATGDAQPFTDDVNNLSGRERTTESVTWSDIPTWEASDVGNRVESPSLVSVIQEIVDNADWSAGNSLAIMVEGNGRRSVSSYDGNSADAPILQIEYENDTAAFDENGYFLMLVAPTVDIPDEEIIPKDVILVLDTSGSMSGDKIDQARSALLDVIGRLNPDDRFNIVPFSSAASAYSTELVPASDPGNYQSYVNNLTAAGGTNINDALLTALDQVDPDRLTTILFLSDGSATAGETNTQRILDNIAPNTGENVRLFSFGVGNPDLQLLESLTSAHRGETTVIEREDEVEAAVTGFYNTISRPVLTNITIDFGDVPVQEITPAGPYDLFVGEQLVVTGRYRDDMIANGTLMLPITATFPITLTGDYLGELQTFVYEGMLTAGGGDEVLSVEWARRTIDDLLAEITIQHGFIPEAWQIPDYVTPAIAELADSVKNLGIQYSIVTPFTSYLVEEPDLIDNGGGGGDPFAGFQPTSVSLTTYELSTTPNSLFLFALFCVILSSTVKIKNTVNET